MGRQRSRRSEETGGTPVRENAWIVVIAEKDARIADLTNALEHERSKNEALMLRLAHIDNSQAKANPFKIAFSQVVTFLGSVGASFAATALGTAPQQYEAARAYYVSHMGGILAVIVVAIVLGAELTLAYRFIKHVTTVRRRAASTGSLLVYGVQAVWAASGIFGGCMAALFSHTPGNLRFDVVIAVVGTVALAYNARHGRAELAHRIGRRPGRADVLGWISDAVKLA
jgi:hypothetical protein